MASYKQYFAIFVLFVIYAVVLLSYFPVVNNIWEYSFDDGTYSHAFFIPVITAYLYYQLFKQNKLILREKPHTIALISLIITTLFLNFFIYAQFPSAYRLLIVLVISTAIASAFKVHWKVLFPSLFLIFLLPIWGVLTPFLQNLSTYVVTHFMRFTHIPTFVEGNLIAIPEGVFEIAGGCSGLRYLLVSLTISSLFTFLNFNKLRQGFVFITIAIIGALIVNWIRIIILIFVGHYTNMESDLMHDHNMLGWYLYIPFMFFLFHIGHKLIETNETKANKENNTATIYSFTSMNSYYYNLTIIMTIIISSAFLSQALVTKLTDNSLTHPQTCASTSKVALLPAIHNASAQCSQVINKALLTTYYFDPLILDSKADFYLNQLTINNAKIITHTTTQSWQISEIYYQGQHYLTAISFITGDSRAATIQQYKKMKLLNLLKGQPTSKLQWLVQTCTQNCKLAQQQFITSLKQLPLE